jgi:NADP-reducing hydrogenase subunit HndD
MYHPEMLGNVSTAKSPQQIFGALIKTYYAQKQNIDPSKIFVVTLMPCVTKQSEAERVGGVTDGHDDVNMTLTVRQLIMLIKELGIDFVNLPDTKFDDPFGLSGGAGLIFGTTGGVTEAALRTLSEKILGKRLDNIDFHNVRGEKGIKVAELKLGKEIVKVAIVSGIANAEKILQSSKDYHFIEIMACMGGCVNGGGMPVHDAHIQDNFANAMERAKTLYHMDKYNNLRRSHENPSVKRIYDEYLGEPNSELAHKILHTHYEPKKKYND